MRRATTGDSQVLHTLSGFVCDYCSQGFKELKRAVSKDMLLDYALYLWSGRSRWLHGVLRAVRVCFSSGPALVEVLRKLDTISLSRTGSLWYGARVPQQVESSHSSVKGARLQRLVVREAVLSSLERIYGSVFPL